MSLRRDRDYGRAVLVDQAKLDFVKVQNRAILDFMESQVSRVIQDKILTAIETPPPVLTRRDIHLPSIRDKAFAIVGMRRAGKTTYMHQLRADRLAAGSRPEQLIYFNFEDERLGEFEARQLTLILDTHARLFPDLEHQGTTFYFDEIQRVPGWEVFVRRLLDMGGYNLFLSGSSAKLLSREIATSMRGRAWEIDIFPFSFREYRRHHGLETPEGPNRLTRRQALRLDSQWADYLAQGGFPEAQSLNAIDRRQLLQNYVDIVLLRDIIERHNITNPTALRWMVRRLLGSPAGLFSVSKLFADLKSQGIAAGRETLFELLDHLEDAFLLHTVAIATDSKKQRQVNARKVYPADSALIPVFDRSAKANIGHALETVVCIELLRRGFEVAYVRTPGGYEVDFLARGKGGEQLLIQVCASIDDAATRGREVRALLDAQALYPDATLVLLMLESRLPAPEVPAEIQLRTAWEWALDAER